MKAIKLIERIALTIFVFSLFGWIYIIGNGWFHPESLKLPSNKERFIKYQNNTK